VSSKNQELARPALDRIPRVDDAVSVGEDLDFQRRWWRFEQVAWLLLVLVLVADGLGAFGRGWLARAQQTNQAGSLHVRYERIERTGTPSEMTMEFTPAAVHNGRIRLFVSDAVVEELGAQRVIPQPLVSQVGPDGVIYTFPAIDSSARIRIAMQPSFPGIHRIQLGIPGTKYIEASIAVLP
jgi:hypothetical protein